MPKRYELEIHYQQINKSLAFSLEDAKEKTEFLIKYGVKTITHINVIERQGRKKTILLTKTRRSQKRKK